MSLTHEQSSVTITNFQSGHRNSDHIAITEDDVSRDLNILDEKVVGLLLLPLDDNVNGIGAGVVRSHFTSVVCFRVDELWQR